MHLDTIQVIEFVFAAEHSQVENYYPKQLFFILYALFTLTVRNEIYLLINITHLELAYSIKLSLYFFPIHRMDVSSVAARCKVFVYD